MHWTKLIGLAGLACVMSAAPVAKITTVAGVLINGKQVPDKTAPTWPVVGNDVVATTTKSAVLILPNGDRALLEPGSSVRLLDQDGAPTLDVVGGELCLLVHGKSNLKIIPSNAESPITYPFEGSMTFNASMEKPVVKKGGCRFRAGALKPAVAAGTAAGAAGAASAGAGAAAGVAAVGVAGAAAAGIAALATGKGVTAASPSQP